MPAADSRGILTAVYPGPISKLRAWIALALRRPREAVDRLGHYLDRKRDDGLRRAPEVPVTGLDEVLTRAAALGSLPVEELLGECAELEERLLAREDQDSAIARAHDADLTLARTCYVAARALAPEVAVETGVAHGVTSTFLLQALARNARGRLESIDLPPLGDGVARYVGSFVPDALRGRWTLHRGSARRLLPALLERLGDVGLFVHDSLHSYRNIAFELDRVTPRLARPAIVIADDVQDNAAFRDWVDRVRPAYWAVVQGEAKRNRFGVAIFCPERSAGSVLN